MPTLAVHLAVVAEAAAIIGDETLSNHQGDLFLGSTCPDIRNLIGVPREATHYVSLGDTSGACGIGCFLEAHQAATEFSLLSGAAKCFVAGYLSHLVTDATWIAEIYRPFFGKSSALADLRERDMLDRALQFDLEQRERRQLGRFEAICALIAGAEGFANLGVADDDVLRRWRGFICGALDLEDVAQRFRYFARSFAREGQMIPVNRSEGFVQGFPALLARALQHVPEGSIASFRQKSIDATVEVIREFLSADFQSLLKR